MEHKVLFNHSDIGPEKYGAIEEVTMNKKNVTTSRTKEMYLLRVTFFHSKEARERILHYLCILFCWETHTHTRIHHAFFFFFFRAAPAMLLAYTTATATWDLSCIYDLHHSSRQRQILNPLSEAGDQTYVLMDASQIRFRWDGTATPHFNS